VVVDNLRVIYREREFHLEVSRSEAFRLSEEALIIVGGRISLRDQAAGRLAATTPFSFKSFGETVQVEVSGANGDIRVQVKSASRLPTTLVDWGTNDDNIRRFGDWLTKTA
jgi:hypothetical protein